MSALPSAEEIKLKIKVEKGLTEKQLEEEFERIAAKYTAHAKSSELIWFLLAKDLKVPVAVRKSDASRPAVELPSKEEFIHLIGFDETKHFVFNARGYILDKWFSRTESKSSGGVLLSDETKTEKIVVFGEHEEWLKSVEIGRAYHFQGLGFMEANTDTQGRDWPRSFCTGFRTQVEEILPGEYSLPTIDGIGLALAEVEHLLPKSTSVLRGVVIEAEMRDKYVGCPKPGCYKGTGLEEGQKTRCEKCSTLISGITLQEAVVTLQDWSNAPLRARFPPWFELNTEEIVGEDVLVIGEYNDQYKVLDGVSMFPIKEFLEGESIPAIPPEGSSIAISIDDLDFSRDEETDAVTLDKDRLIEYLDMIESEFPELMKAMKFKTTPEGFSRLVEMKWAQKVAIRPIIKSLLEDSGYIELKRDDDGEGKIFWIYPGDE